jgi:hypothetical protein
VKAPDGPDDPVPVGEVTDELLAAWGRVLGYRPDANGGWRRSWWRAAAVWVKWYLRIWRRV